jgi:uncharacterized protein YndB with AHSA1/START domain
MTKQGRVVADTTDREIVSSRVLAANREEVFRAFSDPGRLAEWWGPAGFTNTFQEFDFRPGGRWRFTMHGPDGNAYEMNKRFTEIVAPEKIVLDHAQSGHDFTMTITLAAQGDRTAVVWRMHFFDAAEAEKIRAFILQANEQNFDRLAAHLAD